MWDIEDFFVATIDAQITGPSSEPDI